MQLSFASVAEINVISSRINGLHTLCTDYRRSPDSEGLLLPSFVRSWNYRYASLWECYYKYASKLCLSAEETFETSIQT